MYYYLWSLFFSNTFSTKKNRWTLCSAKMLQQLGIFLTLPAKICSLSSVSDIISQVNTWISTRHSPKVNSANTIAVSFSSSSNLGYFFFSHSIFTCRKRSPGWNVQSLYHMCMSSKGESNVHSFCFVTDYSQYKLLVIENQLSDTMALADIQRVTVVSLYQSIWHLP